MTCSVDKNIQHFILFLTLVFALIILQFAIAISLMIDMKQINEKEVDTLKFAMQLAVKEPSMEGEIRNIQKELDCCGLYNWTDWVIHGTKPNVNVVLESVCTWENHNRGCLSSLQSRVYVFVLFVALGCCLLGFIEASALIYWCKYLINGDAVSKHEISNNYVLLEE